MFDYFCFSPDGSKKQMNDIPQQDYQAHEDKSKGTSGHGSRGKNWCNPKTDLLSNYCIVWVISYWFWKHEINITVIAWLFSL